MVANVSQQDAADMAAVRRLRNAFLREPAKFQTASSDLWAEILPQIRAIQDAKFEPAYRERSIFDRAFLSARRGQVPLDHGRPRLQQWYLHFRTIQREAGRPLREGRALEEYLNYAGPRLLAQRIERGSPCATERNVHDYLLQGLEPNASFNTFGVPGYQLARKVWQEMSRPIAWARTNADWYTLGVLFLLSEAPDISSIALGLPVELSGRGWFEEGSAEEAVDPQWLNTRQGFKSHVKEWDPKLAGEDYRNYNSLLKQAADAIGEDQPSREASAGGAESSASKDVRVARDFTWLRVGDVTYEFARGQPAAILKVLWDEWERSGRKDGCGMGAGEIKDLVSSDSERFRVDHVLRGHPALGTIISRPGKGRWALYLSA